MYISREYIYGLSTVSLAVPIGVVCVSDWAEWGSGIGLALSLSLSLAS